MLLSQQGKTKWRGKPQYRPNGLSKGNVAPKRRWPRPHHASYVSRQHRERSREQEAKSGIQSGRVEWDGMRWKEYFNDLSQRIHKFVPSQFGSLFKLHLKSERNDCDKNTQTSISSSGLFHGGLRRETRALRLCQRKRMSKRWRHTQGQYLLDIFLCQEL